MQHKADRGGRVAEINIFCGFNPKMNPKAFFIV
jgi:hypothetical protein